MNKIRHREILIDILNDIKADYIDYMESIKENDPDENAKFLSSNDKVDAILDIQDELRALNGIEKLLRGEM